MKVLALLVFVSVIKLSLQYYIDPVTPPADIPTVSKVGGFHAGGRTVILEGLPLQNVTLQVGQPPRSYDPNGEFTTGQMYMHYTKLKNPLSPYPFVLMHGGYMTGASWEDTPDGRDGWQSFFLRAGFNVYVGDAMERGRSGWSKYPEIFPGPPLFATKKYAWETFRVGPVSSYFNETHRTPYSPSLFPYEAFDQFHKQTVPRWSTTDEIITAAYVDLIDEICVPKCILVGHSQGGTFAYNVTIQRPEKIAAVITLEPGSAPLLGFDASVLRDVKHLTIWGDNYNNSVVSWRNNYVVGVGYNNYLRDAGVSIDQVELTSEYNMYGNSHFLMLDTNSDQIAEIAYAWLLNNSFVSAPLVAGTTSTSTATSTSTSTSFSTSTSTTSSPVGSSTTTGAACVSAAHLPVISFILLFVALAGSLFM